MSRVGGYVSEMYIPGKKMSGCRKRNDWESAGAMVDTARRKHVADRAPAYREPDSDSAVTVKRRLQQTGIVQNRFQSGKKHFRRRARGERGQGRTVEQAGNREFRGSKQVGRY